MAGRRFREGALVALSGSAERVADLKSGRGVGSIIVGAEETSMITEVP